MQDLRAYLHPKFHKIQTAYHQLINVFPKWYTRQAVIDDHPDVKTSRDIYLHWLHMPANTVKYTPNKYWLMDLHYIQKTKWKYIRKYKVFPEILKRRSPIKLKFPTPAKSPYASPSKSYISMLGSMLRAEGHLPSQRTLTPGSMGLSRLFKKPRKSYSPTGVARLFRSPRKIPKQYSPGTRKSTRAVRRNVRKDYYYDTPPSRYRPRSHASLVKSYQARPVVGGATPMQISPAKGNISMNTHAVQHFSGGGGGGGGGGPMHLDEITYSPIHSPVKGGTVTRYPHGHARLQGNIHTPYHSPLSLEDLSSPPKKTMNAEEFRTIKHLSTHPDLHHTHVKPRVLFADEPLPPIHGPSPPPRRSPRFQPPMRNRFEKED